MQQSVRSSYRASRVDSEVDEDEDEFGPDGKPIQTMSSPVTSVRDGEANGGGQVPAEDVGGSVRPNIRRSVNKEEREFVTFVRLGFGPPLPCHFPVVRGSTSGPRVAD